jgi:uncharacterized protein (TIGR03067 family)
MSTHARLVCAAGLLLAFGGAGGGLAQPPEELQGTWNLVAQEVNGIKVEDNLRTIPVQLVLKGTRYYQTESGRSVEDGTFTADPTKKPATIDWAITRGQAVGKTQLSIYQLQGDTLQLCLAPPGDKERPTGFTTTTGNGWYLLVFKRAPK